MINYWHKFNFTTIPNTFLKIVVEASWLLRFQLYIWFRNLNRVLALQVFNSLFDSFLDSLFCNVVSFVKLPLDNISLEVLLGLRPSQKKKVKWVLISTLYIFEFFIFFFHKGRGEEMEVEHKSLRLNKICKR